MNYDALEQELRKAAVKEMLEPELQRNPNEIIELLLAVMASIPDDEKKKLSAELMQIINRYQ